MPIRHCFFAFLFSFSFYCSAAADSSCFYHITIDNGLPTNNIYSVIQDHLGYIWMTTDNGVVKYNGYSFKVFNTNDGLSSNDVWRVYEDTKGRVWCLSNSYRIGYIKDDIYYTVHLSDSNNFINPRQVVEVGGLVMLSYTERNESKIAIVKDDSVKIINLMSFPRLFNLWDGKFGTDASIWFLTNYKDGITVARWNPRDGIPTVLRACRAKNYEFAFLIKDSYPLTYQNKYYSYQPNEDFFNIMDIAHCQFSRIYLDKQNHGDKIALAFVVGKKIKVITRRYFYTIDAETSTIDSRQAIPAGLNSSLSWNYSDPSFADWYCTNSDGVYIESKFPQLSRNIHPLPGMDEIKLVGTYGSNTFCWDMGSEELLVINRERVILKKKFRGMGQLRAVSSISPSEWLMVFVKGNYKYNFRTGAVTDFFATKSLSITDTLMFGIKPSMKSYYFFNGRRIERISDSCYIFFGYSVIYKAIVRKDEILTLVLINEKLTGLLNDTVHNLLFLYNKKNVFLFDRNWHGLKLSTRMLSSMGISDIQNILEDPQGNFIVHAENGIFYCNSLTRRVRRLHTNLNFSSSWSFIWKRYFIVVGNFGLAYCPIGEKEGSTGFHMMANLKNSSFNRITACSMDSSGTIYIKGDKALFVLAFDSVLQRRGLFSFEKDTLFHFCIKSPFQQKLRKVDTIRLDQDAGTIALDVVNFFGSNNQFYRYRIKRGKMQTSSSGEIFLRGISPGEYYRIEYYAQDAFWKSDIHLLYIYQPFKWYQTTMWRTVFWLTGVLLFGLSLLTASIVTRRRVAKSSERKRWLTELELRAVHSQINPHFIFNTLSTALFYISKQRSTEAYDHVSRFSKLLRGYLKSSRERLIILAEEMEMLEQYIKLQNARFQHPFLFEIKVSPNLNPSKVVIPSLLLQPLVENAINHGLFHKGEHGILLINFSMGENETEVICSIEDNGVGRVQSKLIQKNLKYDKESYGSKLTSELIEVFQKYEQMDISINYVDKEFPETGTIVRLKIRNARTIG